MALHAVDPNDPVEPDPCEVLEICPICGGSMDTVYSRDHQKVCVCVDCHTTITVPAGAWKVKSAKQT
jgi:ssDNA-binding Zn-finger/Zn-ribbon topoisomerase 1